MTIEEFVQQLEADILDEAKSPSYLVGDPGDQGEEDFRENAFTRIAIRDLVDAGALASPVACHYAGAGRHGDFKINAYEVSEEDMRLSLVIADYRPLAENRPARLVAADLDRAFRQAERFLEFAVNPGGAGPDPSGEAHAMIYEISSKREQIRSVQIALITNGVISVRREKARKTLLHGFSVSHDSWDAERLMRFRAAGSSHEPIEVDLSRLPGGGLPCLSHADPVEGYSTSVALVPGSTLADWYDEYGSRLLELNVRSYLQATGKINRGILETLITYPRRFLAYNNGITIVAEEIEFNPQQDRISRLRGIQIVNGGQTTASIHRARRESKADVSGVYVQAKITKVPTSLFEQVVPEISRFSNTQNKVSNVDLRARDSFHVGLERFAQKQWVPGEGSKWFYERARGSYQTERSRVGRTRAQRDRFDKQHPPSQRITKEDIARYVNAYNCFPHVVSLGGQKNFLKFMDGLSKYPKDWEPTLDEYQEIVGKAILYRGVQELVRQFGKTSFRVNVVNYVVALIGQRTEQGLDFAKIWNQQGLSEGLKTMIKSWIPRVEDVLTESAAGKNPTEWFKKEQCWEVVRERLSDLSVPANVARDLRDGNGTGGVRADADNIATCKGLEAMEWFHVYQWGAESGTASRQQLDIARRMAELAASGWKKSPTGRQAAEGASLLVAYRNRE